MQLTIKIRNIGDGLIVEYSELDLDQGCGGSGYFAASTMDEVLKKAQIMSVGKDDWYIKIDYDPVHVTPYFIDEIKLQSQSWFDNIKNPKPTTEGNYQ